MATEFDVFLSHNSGDKPLVEQVGNRLRAKGLTVWLDRWELRPGFPWQEGIEGGLKASKAVAVCIGAAGLGTWQEPEMRAALNRAQHEKIPVIPVLLPGSPETPALELFLAERTWVDLRQGLSDDGIADLIWGITGIKSEPQPEAEAGKTRVPGRGGQRAVLEWLRRHRPRRPLDWGIVLGILGVAVTLAAWLRPVQPPVTGPTRPAAYALRVHVVDPQGQPVSGASVGTSASNERLQLPDDEGWQIDIPAVRLPANGRIIVWARHPDWGGNSAPVQLQFDPNPQLTIRLKEPSSWIRGQVVDGAGHGVPGVSVGADRGTNTEVVTNADGRFALALALPADQPVELHFQHGAGPAQTRRWYAGRDGFELNLDER